MSLGDLKLIGATTGIPGLFLGPLWYYVGVFGYLLTSGNPYGVQMWYIAIASLSLPLYWLLGKRLFGKTVWAPLAALLLSLTPGGITGTNFVWNCMLSLPLMAGSLLCLLEAKRSKWFLFGGFFLLALTLQSEFAYAIFFVVSLWMLIPWLRGKFEWKLILLTIVTMGITLLPQIAFEGMHGFSMTKAVLNGTSRDGTTLPLPILWQQRPLQLWQSTIPFFVRSDFARIPLLVGLVISLIISLVAVAIKRQKEWILVAVMAVLPYVWYMFWNGNYGFFFDYYITPHFIFLILLLVYGWQSLIMLFKNKVWRWSMILLVAIFIGIMGFHSYTHLNNLIFHPVNNAGLYKMEQAVQRLYDWSLIDQPPQSVFRIYTPNMATSSYDYLVWWLSKTKGYTHPSTVQSPSDTVHYVMYEPDEMIREKRFLPWYKDATLGMQMTRQEKVGILTLETWSK